ncbi:MAG: hypothetical protein JO040_05120, partial [Gemmatimonadetes bacterium]|nr:hypothetical protein [Gemmatimonadota bacterium]
SVPVGVGRRVQAVPTPAGAGTFAWLALQPSELALPTPADTATVEVTGHRPAGAAPVSAVRPLILCVLFTPAGGSGVMATHGFTRIGNLFGRIEDRSVAPENTAVPAGHVFLPVGTPFEIHGPGGAVVFSGMTDADGYFAASVAGSGPFELVVPGFAGLVT